MPREVLELYGPWFKHPDGRFVDWSEMPKGDAVMTPTEADRILKLASDAFEQRTSRVVDLDSLTLERLIFLARHGALKLRQEANSGPR